MIRSYLTKLLLGRILSALFGLSAMLQLLDLLEKAGTIFAHGGFLDILHFTRLRVPSILAEMLPLAVLIGAVLTFRRLASALEMTTLRAAGMSLWQVVLALTPVCLLLSIVHFGLQTEVGPRADRALADWWAATIPDPSSASPPPRLWLRSGGDVAAIDEVSLDGRSLRGVMVLERAPSGEMTARLDAGTATYEGGRWILHDVRIAQADSQKTYRQETAIWPQGPEPANMIELARRTDSMRLDRLVATIRGRWVGSQGPDYYWTQLDGMVASVLAPIIMVLLAAPILLAPPRTDGNGAVIATSLALGLGYLTCTGLLEAFGEAGTLPPWLAGGLATSFFAGFALLRLIQADDV